MLKLARLLALAGIASMASATARAQDLLLNSFLPPQHEFNTKVYKPWAQDVEKATQGRVRMKFPPTSVGSPQQQWDIVRKHIVDGAFIFNGLVQNQVPLEQIAHLPLGSTTAKGMSVALWRTHQKYFEATHEYNDVQLLALFAFPSGQIFSMKEPLQSAEAMNGVKMWAGPGVPAKLAEDMHAAVVATPAATMTSLIAGGTVDGYMGIPVMDAVQFNVVRYAKSETYVPGGVNAPSFSLFVNKASWESISPADRDVIAKLSGEAFGERLAVLDQTNETAAAKAAAGGMTLLQASLAFVAQIGEIAAGMDAQWIAAAAKLNVDGKAALGYYRSEAKAAR